MSMKKILQIIQAQMIEEGRNKFSNHRVGFRMLGVGNTEKHDTLINVSSILRVDDDVVMFEAINDKQWNTEYIRIIPHNNICIAIKKGDPLLERIKKSMEDLTPFI